MHLGEAAGNVQLRTKRPHLCIVHTCSNTVSSLGIGDELLNFSCFANFLDEIWMEIIILLTGYFEKRAFQKMVR